MKKTLSFAAAVCVLCLAGDRSAQAGTSSGTLSVTALVSGSCTISNATLDFTGGVGTGYDGSADVTTSKQLNVNCGTATIHWDLAAGGGTSGNISDRTMVQGSNVLHYQLYKDSAHTLLWGDGTTGTTFFGDTGTPTTQPTVYGLIAAGQSGLHTGTYNDSVAMTITF